MTKKIFYTLIIICFIGIFAFHFTINFNKRSEPPSSDWSKEVWISSGNVGSNPALIKLNNNFILTYSDGNNIKILSIDNLGNKLNEKVFNSKGIDPYSTNVVTDGKNLYLYWLISENGKKIVYSIKLDDKFNQLEEDQINGADSVIQIGSSVIVIDYADRVETRDYSINKSSVIPAQEPGFLSGTKYKEGYLISFRQKNGQLKYFELKNGAALNAKSAGSAEETSSNVFISSALVTDESYGYILMEYRSKGEFGGTKQIKFQIGEEGKFEIDDFKVNKEKVNISNIISYNSNSSAKFLAKKYESYDKKNTYENIVEYDMKNQGKFIPVSRTKEVSMFPAVYENTVVFCDTLGSDNFNIYMTSKDEAFIKAHNNIRMSEIKLASIDTISGVMFSLAYILLYGLLWVIPTLGIVSLYSIIEYKQNARKKKISFALIYAASFGIKAMSIHAISYIRFGYYLPPFMTFGLTLVLSAIISLICGIYAYKQYSNGIEDNIGAMTMLPPVVYDAVLTLMLLVPFIV